MIILASGSPRRKELLSSITTDFEIITSNADETPESTVPTSIVEELSRKKGEEVFERVTESKKIDINKENLIISADTLVFYKDERMGKPKDKEDAIRMIKALSGNTHEVITGVTLTYTNKGKVTRKSFHEITKVLVYPLSDKEIEEYVASGEPMDKAGAYAIQGLFGKYIKSIDGEYANVVGLPIARLYHEMKLIMGE